MLNKWTMAVTLATCSIAPAVAQQHVRSAVTAPAVAVRSANPMTSETSAVFSRNPEFGMLLCLGAVFVGSAALFSARRSEL
ncbi:hypothetical protein [Terriglobus roseus]|uniref:hypothetical protein n=1 Tax=Terriglobus roseus TaxID=392734 RepID=UPI0002FDBFD8|nr:hypothetical protein [Terriglobus roseus]